MRRYIALVSFVAIFSGSVATAGANRVPASVKKHVSSAMTAVRGFFLPSDKSHSKLQQLIAVAGLGIISCTTISCGGALLNSNNQFQQLGFAGNEVFGQHVHAVVDNESYVGYVSEIISSTEVILDLYDGSQKTILASQISGTLDRENSDGGASIFLKSDELGIEFLHGFVVSVYSDGYYEVMVGAEVYRSDSILDRYEAYVLEEPYIVVIHRDKIWEDPLGE